jgi:hypothetical protein
MKTPDGAEANLAASAEAAGAGFFARGKLANGMACERRIHKGGQP